MADTVFREARWRRAGATDKQLAGLRAAHADLTAPERAAEAVRVDSVSDSDLAAELAADEPDLIAGSKDDVLARVGGDRELAAVALSKEQVRKPKPRQGLLDALNQLLAAQPPDG